MFLGTGAVTKLGKLDELGELVEVAVKKGDEFVEGATTLSKIDELKKLARHIDNDKALDDLIKEFGTDTFDSHLDELLDAAKLLKDKNRKEFLKIIERFRLGRKLETNVTQKIEKELAEAGGDYIEELAQKFGLSVEELAGTQRLTQLQLHLKKEDLMKLGKKGIKETDLQDTWVTLDNVFVKELRDTQDRFIGYKLYANETKLSSLSTLTTNQSDFLKMLQNGKVEFELRSVRKEVKDVFKDKRSVTIEKWVQTTGKGVEQAENLTVKALF